MIVCETQSKFLGDWQWQMHQQYQTKEDQSGATYLDHKLSNWILMFDFKRFLDELSLVKKNY